MKGCLLTVITLLVIAWIIFLGLVLLVWKGLSAAWT